MIEKESDRIDAVIMKLRTTLDDGNGIRRFIDGTDYWEEFLNEATNKILLKLR
ncbi:hypothetical protein KHA80_22390 [Anaerobacillus sp. HL2]|nr:hypothetical protein KHA80_22390 [Anaerobacillus sp. HL2]